MGMKDPWSAQQLVVAAQQLHAARLYERFSDHDGFLIRTPKLDAPAVAVLMGHGGETFGLNVFLGPSAMAAYRSLLDAAGEAQAHRTMRRSHLLGYQMSDAMHLSHDARRWLKKAKIRPGVDQWYPDPMSIQPGKVPVTVLKDSEARLLLHLVRGILAAGQEEAFKPCGVDRNGQVLCVQLNEDSEHPKAVIAWEHCAFDSSSPQPGETDAVEPAAARFDLSGLDANDDTWLVTLLPVPASIQGDDRQPHMLVVCSQRSQSLFPSLLMETEPADLVEALARLMRDEAELPEDMAQEQPFAITPPPAGLPACLVLDSKALHDAVCGAFVPLGVQCIDGSDHPDLQAMFDELHASLDANLLDGAEDDFPQDDRIPAADDIHGWKQVDGWLKDMIHDGFDHDRRYRGARALKRYFGPDADPGKLFKTYRRLMIVDSYAHWFATSYRSANRQPTLAQQWLDDPSVPHAVKTLLHAVLAQGPSIYRIDSADEDTGKIVFADLFTDDVTIVTDFAMSTCLEPGWLVPAKLVPAGDFHFAYPAGPVMSGFQSSAAMALLDEQGITTAPQKLRDQPHLLGRLWDAFAQYGKQALDLRNSDGHALVPHTAHLACPNRSALKRFLAQRPDCEPDGDAPNAWVWFRPNTPMPADKLQATHLLDTQCHTTAGPVTLLGQIEWRAGRLTLTTNSRERFDAARAMLELIKGVRLISVQAKPIPHPTDDAADLDDDAEPDDDAPTQPDDASFVPDEAMLDAARDFLANHYRRWLDLPIPALRNKTPRQAAQDPKLRPQLAAMVRAMPDPTNLSDRNIQITAPRQMLLAQLGLD
jgi:hypothetical protein